MASKEEMKQAIKEAEAEIRRDRQRRRAVGEMATLVIGIFGIAGTLAAVSPELFIALFGLIFAGAGLLAAGFMAFTLTRSGRSLGVALLLTLLTAGLSFLVMYGLMWYLIQSVSHSRLSLFIFGV